ncbi:MAG: hypothetical protein AAFY83_10000 [Pseudomonadota bacterium]
MRVSALISVIILVLAAALFSLGDFSKDNPDVDTQSPVRFGGAFLALSDTDMAGTAYADGQLEPIDAIDTLSLIADGAVTASVPASNSVISWPQVIDIAPDGKQVFVVETRGAAPDGVTAFDDVRQDFPAGSTLSIFSLVDGTLSLIGTRTDIGTNPGSVEFAKRSGFLVIAAKDKGKELTIVGLRWDGSVREVRRLALNIDYFPNEENERVRTVHIAPDGRTLAVNIANRRVQFFTLDIDSTGLPRAAIPIGNPTNQFGKRLSVGKWTPDGRFFITTDTGWSDNALAMMVQGPGTLSVIAPPRTGGNPKIVSQQTVGLSPEGFDISIDGTQVATIDMGRTYLPPHPALSFWPARRSYTITLLTLDPNTGILTRTDQIARTGILPEDILFDARGKNLAVAVFHRRTGPDRQRGFIDFFSINEGTLTAQKATRVVPRGVHDLVLVPSSK